MGVVAILTLYTIEGMVTLEIVMAEEPMQYGSQDHTGWRSTQYFCWIALSTTVILLMLTLILKYLSLFDTSIRVSAMHSVPSCVDFY